MPDDLYGLTRSTAQKLGQLLREGPDVVPPSRAGTGPTQTPWVKVTGAAVAGWHAAKVHLPLNDGTWKELPADVQVESSSATPLVTGVRYPATRVGDGPGREPRFAAIPVPDGWHAYGTGEFTATGGTGVPPGWFAEQASGARYTDVVGVLTEPGYYLLWLSYSGAQYPLTPAGLAEYHTNLRVWWKGQQGAIPSITTGGQIVCTASGFKLPQPDGSTRWLLNAGGGSGCLLGAVNLTAADVPYAVAVQWDACVVGINNAPAVATLVTTQRYVGGLTAVRVPAVRLQGAAGVWSGLPRSQPSLPPPPPPGAPVAVDDGYTVPVGGRLTVNPPGVLANDTAPAGYAAELVSPPGLGTLTLSPNGGFTYTQTANVTGLRPPVEDRFTYRLTNGTTASAPATVTLSIF